MTKTDLSPPPHQEIQKPQADYVYVGFGVIENQCRLVILNNKGEWSSIHWTITDRNETYKEDLRRIGEALISEANRL